jgi:hypothetical protein
MALKALTVRIDERVIRRAKAYAKETGLKLYVVVESSLKTTIPEKAKR